MSLKPVLSQNKNTNEEFGAGKKMVVKFLPKQCHYGQTSLIFTKILIKF